MFLGRLLLKNITASHRKWSVLLQNICSSEYFWFGQASVIGGKVNRQAILSIETFVTVVTVVNKRSRKMNRFYVISDIIFLRIAFSANGAEKV